jgi:hypothetical protein
MPWQVPVHAPGACALARLQNETSVVRKKERKCIFVLVLLAVVMAAVVDCPA